MKIAQIVILPLLGLPLFAQFATQDDLATVIAKKVRHGTAVPMSCSAGQVFIDDDATAGSQFYGCSGGSFVLQGSGSGTGCVPSGSAGQLLTDSGAGACTSNTTGTGVLTFLGTPSGANLASALTSALPASKGGTGLTSLGTGVATWLGTPSGANLASALTSALPNTKGGTGQDSSASSGIPHVSAGTWSFSSIVNADVSASAAIALSKLATQSADTIVMNATGGAAVPTAVATPSGGTNGCAGTTDASTYNSSTHAWGCHQIGGSISGLTTNKIPKASSSTTIADSSLSDDGTTVSTTEALSVGVGSANAGLVGYATGAAGTVPSNQWGLTGNSTMTTSQFYTHANTTTSAHSLLIAGAPTSNVSTLTPKVVPDCQDAGGNHLNFTQSTDAFSCGTSGGGSVTDSSYLWTYTTGADSTATGITAPNVVSSASCCDGQRVNGGMGPYWGLLLQKNSASNLTITYTIPAGWDGTVSVKSVWFLQSAGQSGTAVHTYALSCHTPGTSDYTTASFSTADTVNTSVSGTYYTFVDTASPTVPTCAAGDDITIKILRTDNTLVDSGVYRVGISLPHTVQ